MPIPCLVAEFRIWSDIDRIRIQRLRKNRIQPPDPEKFENRIRIQVKRQDPDLDTEIFHLFCDDF